MFVLYSSAPSSKYSLSYTVILFYIFLLYDLGCIPNKDAGDLIVMRAANWTRILWTHELHMTWQVKRKPWWYQHCHWIHFDYSRTWVWEGPSSNWSEYKLGLRVVCTGVHQKFICLVSQAFDEPTPRDSKVELMFRQGEGVWFVQQQSTNTQKVPKVPGRSQRFLQVPEGDPCESWSCHRIVTDGLEELQLTMQLGRAIALSTGFNKTLWPHFTASCICCVALCMIRGPSLDTFAETESVIYTRVL